jgi:hypothetical protein
MGALRKPAIRTSASYIKPAHVRTWLEIEARFRALAPSLKSARLDAQWGAAGEHWHVSGGVDSLVRHEFELLCGVAGQLLERVYSKKNLDDARLLAITDPKMRWYTLLKQSVPFQNPIYGEQQHSDGTPAGIIYSATLPSPADSSANLCLALQTQHPIVERPSKWQWFHDNYGKALIVGVVLALIGAAIKIFTG